MIRKLGFASALLIAFASGWWTSQPNTSERLAKLYAQYVRAQPSHKYDLPDGGVFPLVAANDYHRAVSALVQPRDIEARRRDAMAFIWRGGAADPFVRRPDNVERDTIEPLLADLDGLESVDRLTIGQPLGLDSIVFYLHAEAPRNCLMLYHEGHRDSFLLRKRFLQKMLSSGCDVLALNLPATGPWNPRPEFVHPRFGHVLISDPDQLEILETRDFGTIQLFLTPPIVALTHALTEKRYERVGMTGFSGGGWITQMVSALDPRIRASYSVAGSSPLAVHLSKLSWGSYEQQMGRLYEIVTYPELYVMGAAGPGRRQMQAYNLHDPCCFAGQNWQAYADAVAERAAAFGGHFQVIMDKTNTTHSMSDEVENVIVADFMGRIAGQAAQPEAKR